MPAPRLPRLLAVAALAVAATLGGAAAPAAAAEDGTGWIRVAHLSPDTKQVDVRLAPLDGAGGVVRIDDVAYGAVSKYRSLTPGTYAVAMRPAGSPESAPPVVQASVTVKAGGAKTVAVFGRNSGLTTKVIQDSLTLPPSGRARVRVVQAATGDDTVSVTAAASTKLVDAAAVGTVSKYTDVPSGPWRLSVARGSDTDTSTVDLTAGQVASLFVLDDASGGTVVKRVIDSASVGGVPKGFLATGGGYLVHSATQQEASVAVVGGGVAALVAVLGGAVLVLLRRRTRA